MNSLANSKDNQMGGKKRSNGHKYSCKCPICVNMKHAKRGGDIDADDKNDSNNYIDDNRDNIGSQIAGNKKKSNGHKKKCPCPICKNMKNKRGGDKSIDEVVVDEEEYLPKNIFGGKKKGNGHKKMYTCPICKNMKKKVGGNKYDESSDKTLINQDEDKENYDNEDEADDKEYNDLSGGKTRRKGGKRTRKGGKSRRNSIKTRRYIRRSNRRH